MTMLMLLAFRLILMFPHGDLDIRIRELTQQIQSDTDSLALYLKRGELYLQHEEYANAQRDFTYCIEKGFVDQFVFLGMSESFLHQGDPESALLYAHQALNLQPGNLSALELKGNAFASSGNFCEAAQTFAQLIDKGANPSPHIFLACADAYAKCTSDDHFEKLISVLQRGIRSSPRNMVLQKHLVGAYVCEKKFEEAIEVQTSIIYNTNFKARPYLERAKIYICWNRIEDARHDLNFALSTIAELPDAKKDLPAIEALRREINDQLAELN